MRLLIVRHAIAEDREAFARTNPDDAQRPLTREGKRRMERGARGLRRVVGSLDLIATSPLVRAAQTARIVAAACGGRLVTIDELEPEARPAAFLRWLRGPRADDGAIVAAVGHEPHLGVLVTWLMTGVVESRVPLRKGGACLLELPDPLPRKGGGATLRWSLPPSLLRRLGA